MKIVVTGSSGLIGSSVVEYFSQSNNKIYGFDNNLRAFFFGKEGDTRWNQKRLEKNYNNFSHVEVDIRDRQKILSLLENFHQQVNYHLD